MSVYPTILLALLFLIVIIAWNYKKCRNRFLENMELFNILNCVTALGVFLSLYYTLAEFRENQEIQNIRDNQEFANLMGALQTEIEMNLQFCNELTDDNRGFSSGKSTTLGTMHSFVLEYILLKGLITDERLSRGLPKDVTLIDDSGKALTAENLQKGLYRMYSDISNINEVLKLSNQVIMSEVNRNPYSKKASPMAIRRIDLNAKMVTECANNMKNNLITTRNIAQALNKYYSLESNSQ